MSVIIFSFPSISSQESNSFWDENNPLPSEQTYREIQSNGRPNLRVDGVDEPELGGIGAPDPSLIPIGDGMISIMLSISGYIFWLIYSNKKRKNSRF